MRRHECRRGRQECLRHVGELFCAAADRGSYECEIVGRGHDLEEGSLQWAHLDHVLQVAVEHVQVHEIAVGTGKVEASWAIEVDLSGGGGGEGAVPEFHEIEGARVAVPGGGEHL